MSVHTHPRPPSGKAARSWNRAVFGAGGLVLLLGALWLAGMTLVLTFGETVMTEFEGAQVDSARLVTRGLLALAYAAILTLAARALWRARSLPARSDSLGISAAAIVAVLNPALLVAAWLRIGIQTEFGFATLIEASIAVAVAELALLAFFLARTWLTRTD